MEQLWCHYSTTVDATSMVDLDLDHLPRSLAEQDDHCATFVQFAVHEH